MVSAKEVEQTQLVAVERLTSQGRNWELGWRMHGRAG